MDFAKGIFNGLGELVDIFNEDVNLLEQMLDGIKSPYQPQLFLKQFPDGSGDHAVYQALTTSPARINGFHGAGPLSLGQIAQAMFAWIKKGIEELIEAVTGLDIDTNPDPSPSGLGANRLRNRGLGCWELLCKLPS